MSGNQRMPWGHGTRSSRAGGRAARLPEKEEAAPKDPAVSCSNTSRAVAFIQRNNAAISRRLAIASAA